MGDPIDTSTGAQILEYTLLTAEGVIPISFNLAYNSLILDEGPVGKAWGHNFGFGAHLEELSENEINVHWSGNRTNHFTSGGNGQFTSSELACRYDKLVRNDDGTFTLTTQGRSVYEFNAAGQLAQLLNEHGQSLTFAYDAEGKLSKITEPVSGVFLA